jgi:tetratricopeptide (TPR) repeat protein
MLASMHCKTTMPLSIAITALAGCASGPDNAPLATEAGSPRPQAVAISAPEATSLLGEPLYAPELDDQTRQEREANLEEARRVWVADHENEQAIIWLGRRLAYLGRYNEAIAVYTDGLAMHPESYRLLRHRGHRYITLRRFPEAVADLERAAALMSGMPDEVEADGLPNPLNTPRSTTQTNVYYHLGLAKYLQGDFTAARFAYRRCLEVSRNDDMSTAASYWLFLSRWRSGDTSRAADVLEPIVENMDIIENFAYHDLLLLFRGARTMEQVTGGENAIDDATRAYGIAVWHLINARDDEANAEFRRIIAGPMWPAFGHIAAEAELARAN